MMSTHADDDVEVTPYGFKVGERLREIRRQQRMSLQEVEAASGDEFKASVLGAYERGERAISVPRLKRLARLYSVPVDQLLPPERARPQAPAAGGPGYVGPVTVDVERVDSYDGPEAEVLYRFVRLVQVQRQDFSGRKLTVRSSDLVALAAIVNTPIEYTARRLDELGLRFESVRE
jgi:transcriptional regulator with XRE-family HTH domain